MTDAVLEYSLGMFDFLTKPRFEVLRGSFTTSVHVWRIREHSDNKIYSKKMQLE